MKTSDEQLEILIKACFAVNKAEKVDCFIYGFCCAIAIVCVVVTLAGVIS